MKKLITLSTCLLVLLACGKQALTEVPALAPETAGAAGAVRTLTLGAQLPESAMGKVAVSTAGKVTWSAGDAFAIYDTDGNKIQMRLVSGAGGATGLFSAEIGEATVDLSVPAVYPYDWAGEGENKAKVIIPEYRKLTDGVPAVMAASLSETNGDIVLSAPFSHVMAVMEFTLQDIPAYACALKLWSRSGAQLNGTYVLNETLDGVTWPDPSERTNTQQTVWFPYKTAYGSDETVTIRVALPAYAYTDLAIRILDGDESVIENTGRTVPAAWSQRAAGDYVAMPLINVRETVGTARDKFVKVNGVKWARGNLCFNQTDEVTTTGFQKYWSLYDEQWKYNNYDAATYNDGTSYDGTAKDTRYTNTSNLFDHFNWGGLGRHARFNSAGNYLTPATAEFSISGKVFTNSTDFVEAEGDDRFATAGWNVNMDIRGDVAFWASKGLWRLPSKAEIATLYVNAGNLSTKKVVTRMGHVVKNGYKVWGVLYVSAPRWISPSLDTSDSEFSEADLESGLFLPKCGRRANSTYVVIQQRVQGTYWCGNFGGIGDYPNNPRILHINGNEILYGYTLGTAYTNNAGYAIRPVLVE